MALPPQKPTTLGNLSIFLNTVVNQDTLQLPASNMQTFWRLSHLTTGLQTIGQPAKLGHIISFLKSAHQFWNVFIARSCWLLYRKLWISLLKRHRNRRHLIKKCNKNKNSCICTERFSHFQQVIHFNPVVRGSPKG